jgi:hypothetical protein
MKYLYLLLVLTALMYSPRQAYGQAYTIKGKVTDTLNGKDLTYSSITLIHAADSIMETFTRSREDGRFTLNTTTEGKYIVMISFPSFADYIDIVTLDKEHPSVDMGTIPMVSKSHLLSEFVLKQQIGAIKIKGDTIEYMADSFKVKDNATVEELLKKLPGLQVNKNGEVVAQGEKVQKILVDGEEFFTDDPAVVTKSLQAKTVEKVQVFDKKSEQTQFTGIDDGTREKTINLQLKDNMKKGFFGKVVAGGGTDGYFEEQGMINAFKGKRKISAFGIMANTGKIGLGWQDKDKFGGDGGRNIEMSDGGDVITIISGGADDFESWRGTYDGQGQPTAWTGGLHYSNKWNQDALHFSSNYRYAKQNIETAGNTLMQINAHDSIRGDYQYYTDEIKNSFSSGQRNRVDGLFEWKPDSNTTIKLTANAGYSDTRSYTKYNSESFFDLPGVDSVKAVFGRNERTITSDAVSETMNASLAYRRKFAKAGRTISLTADEKYKESTSSGEFFSILATEAVSQVDTTFLDKKNNSSNFQVTGNASYTEPLSKKLFVELNYGLTVNNSYSKRLSFNHTLPVEDPNYLRMDYSSDYDFNVLTNKAGANLRYVLKKYNASIGGSVASTNFKQTNNFTGVAATRSYNNFFPRASFVYRPAQQTTFSINYNGFTVQPTIEQIQPLKDITDPVNTVVGNENLKQEFNHSINVRYNDYKILTSVYTYGGAGMTFAKDDISRSERFDSLRRIYQYVNVNGNYSGWAYGGYGWTIKKLDLRVGFNGNINTSRYITYVGDKKNINNNNGYSLSLNFNYDKEKKLNIMYRPSITYNSNNSSIAAASTDYFSYNNTLEASFQLPWKLEIGTDIDWDVRQRIAQFDRNNNAFLWNAYVSKKLLKNDQLEVRAAAFDILNQNIGYSRFGNNGNVTEQNYNVIQRYGMLSLIWNFTKSPLGAPQESGGSQMRFRR